MMDKTQLDGLDELAQAVWNGELDDFGGISTGERCYAALAASRPDLLPDGYSVADAIARLGNENLLELVRRWQCRYKS
jgi:hypothetical protein